MDSKQQIRQYSKLLLLILAAALFGFSAVVIPSTMSDPLFKPYPLFPAVFTAVDELSIVSYPLLFFSGVLLGLIDPERPLLLGLATMTCFPVLAMIEKAKIAGSHPHYPLEFAFYLLLGAVAVGGAYAGRYFHPRLYRILNRS